MTFSMFPSAPRATFPLSIGEGFITAGEGYPWRHPTPSMP